MPLRAIHNRSLADQVFEQICAEILTGHYAPGTNLPAERALSEVFGVNRHVVREALKRLEQVGLVKVSQGGGTRVLDYRRSAGLDLLGIMAGHARGGEEFRSHWLAVLEMRAAIAADVARLCALRADANTRSELLTIARQMKATSNDQELFALEVRFWERMLDGANNIAYRLAFNSLLKSAYLMGPSAQRSSIQEVKSSDFRLPVAAAIAAGDAVTAEAKARDTMRATAEAFAASVVPRGETEAETVPRGGRDKRRAARR